MNKSTIDKLIEKMEQDIPVPDDTEVLNYLEEAIMTRHWDGTIGRPSCWYLHGVRLKGETLREAIISHMNLSKESK